jgi:hypothetical protein
MSVDPSWLDGHVVPEVPTWEPTVPPLEVGSDAARLLYAIWADEDIRLLLVHAHQRVEVASTVAVHLAVRSRARVTITVADPYERAQLVRRLAELLPPDRIGCPASNGGITAPRGIGPVPDRPVDGVHVRAGRDVASLDPGVPAVSASERAMTLGVSAANDRAQSVLRLVSMHRQRPSSWDATLDLGEVPFEVVVAGAPAQ